MTESKSVALPLGYTPMYGTAKSRMETPPKPLAVAGRLCPARIRRCKLGWMEGIEPSGAGATIRCVNRFATSTTHNKYGTKTADACQEHFYRTPEQILLAIHGYGLGGTSQVSILHTPIELYGINILNKISAFPLFFTEKVKNFIYWLHFFSQAALIINTKTNDKQISDYQRNNHHHFCTHQSKGQ